MMDEPYLMEGVKEALCFVSQDVAADLKKAALPGARSPHRRVHVPARCAPYCLAATHAARQRLALAKRLPPGSMSMLGSVTGACTRARPRRREFVLPDGVTNLRGYVRVRGARVCCTLAGRVRCLLAGRCAAPNGVLRMEGPA